MIQFTVFVGGREERTLVVNKLPVTIGRSSENTLPINNPLVSRNHALVDFVDGKFILKDLDSDNGTYLRNQLVEQEVLRDGDEFLVGKAMVQFTITDPALKPDAPGGSLVDPHSGERTMALESTELRKIVEGSASRKQAYLVVEATGRRMRLLRHFAILGRAPSCDLILPGWRVAPKQVLVINEGRHHLAVDLTGRRATRLNGKPMDQEELSDGDILTLGRHQVRFMEEAVRRG